MKPKCKPIKNLSPCFLPPFDPNEHRKRVRKYLKEFNKAIEVALKDKELIKRIRCEEQMDHCPMSLSDRSFICTHTISFTDFKYLKL